LLGWGEDSPPLPLMSYMALPVPVAVEFIHNSGPGSGEGGRDQVTVGPHRGIAFPDDTGGYPQAGSVK